jgi:hypothetical protein
LIEYLTSKGNDDYTKCLLYNEFGMDIDWDENETTTSDYSTYTSGYTSGTKPTGTPTTTKKPGPDGDFETGPVSLTDTLSTCPNFVPKSPKKSKKPKKTNSPKTPKNPKSSDSPTRLERYATLVLFTIKLILYKQDGFL